MKAKKIYGDFFINIILEIFEFSIGLLILNKINDVTNQNVSILKSLDFLIASLVYIVVNVKSLSSFLEPTIKTKIGYYFYSFYTLYVLLGIVFITLDIINFKSGRIVNFYFTYSLILIGIFAKVSEKTFQNLKLRFNEELVKANEKMTDLSQELCDSTKQLKSSYEEVIKENEELKELIKNADKI